MVKPILEHIQSILNTKYTVIPNMMKAYLDGLENLKNIYFVINCFKLMLKHEEFKKIELKKLFFGLMLLKHFKSGTLVYYLAKLSQTKKLKVIHNFFVECHRKNISDVHFSQVKIRSFLKPSSIILFYSSILLILSLSRTIVLE